MDFSFVVLFLCSFCFVCAYTIILESYINSLRPGNSGVFVFGLRYLLFLLYQLCLYRKWNIRSSCTFFFLPELINIKTSNSSGLYMLL